MLALAIQLAAPVAQHARAAPVAIERPNFVVIVADDVGVDLVAAYGEGAAAPCTPSISALAAQGLLFRNAWSLPVCSPTRAALLTGRYGFRTGIGDVVVPDGAGLELAERTLPEMLGGYASTCVGKWHLAGHLGNQHIPGSVGNLHPNLSGFDHFAGSLGGALASYSCWSKVIDGSMATSLTYATTDTVDGAISALQTMPEPWFLYVAFNAPHSPYAAPPSSLCPARGCATSACGTLPANPAAIELGKAMLEAMDTELGRLLAHVDAADPDAFVFFLADNGTASELTEAPFAPAHAKGTLYEGGINVPLIVRGPGVVHGECAALVSVVDLFATCAELAGMHETTPDSISLVPYFANPALALRATVYSERFMPNGGSPPFAEHRRAVRDVRYKLIRASGQPDELYDLLVDPHESTNLLPRLDAGEQAAYDALVAELAALGVR